ncbi:glutathione S-transferase-like isoform X2 [Ambystoma mexicanum]|uniref:glutathione S-transferase-like isoform X2 n=1 Tax=Ambystoma mexicanum TaxID=8296 RepID=UPI0037E9527C
MQSNLSRKNEYLLITSHLTWHNLMSLQTTQSGLLPLEFEEEFLETRQDLLKLLKDGVLLFQQVPMVEMDGMKLVQTRAILSYIAAKYNLYGKNLQERVLIDMFVGGTSDLMELVIMLPFLSADDHEMRLKLMWEKATTRYFPVYEKVLKDHGQNFLVGNQLSFADVHLLETLLSVEETFPTVLVNFPILQAYKLQTSRIPTIQKYLSGSQRKPPLEQKQVQVIKEIYQLD